MKGTCDMNEREWTEYFKTHSKEEYEAEAAKTICTMCGKPFSSWDMNLGDNRYDIFVGYPSSHDTERIQINLCVDCFDKVLDTIVSMCKINPVVDGDWMEHCLKKNDGVIYISRRLGSGGDYKDTPRKRIFIDMDGVLCEYRPAASVDDMMQNGYFASLKPRKEMLDAVKGLIKFGKYDVYVLSAVIAECAEQSKFEKNEWLDRYIPEIGSSHRIFTLCGTNKADAVESITLTDILLDDHSPNLQAWINAGGKAIKVLNECNGMNGTFVTGPRIKIDSTTTLLRALTNI